MEDGGAGGFAVADRCRALRAAVSLGLPPVVETWIPPHRLDVGHSAWVCNGGDIPVRRAVRSIRYCSLRRGAESAGLDHGDNAGPETAAKRD